MSEGERVVYRIVQSDELPLPSDITFFDGAPEVREPQFRPDVMILDPVFYRRIPDPVPALEAEIERLKGLFEPGVAPAIVQGMHDWAEKYGHGGHMSWSPMRTVDDHVAKLEARIAELEGELSRLKVFAGRVARSGHSSFCSCYECETVRVMCPAEGQYDRQGKWQWKPPTPAAAKEQ